jgi:hypothetical protein
MNIPCDTLLNLMIQDIQALRYYQKLTDCVTDQWHRGYRFDDLRLYVEGYITALRHAEVLEFHQVNRLEEEVNGFLFELVHPPLLEPQAY